MCAVTHRAKPYQLAFLNRKSLDDVISTQQSKPSKLFSTDWMIIYFDFKIFLNFFVKVSHIISIQGKKHKQTFV